jgi:hypothetical protein
LLSYPIVEIRELLDEGRFGGTQQNPYTGLSVGSEYASRAVVTPLVDEQPNPRRFSTTPKFDPL